MTRDQVWIIVCAIDGIEGMAEISDIFYEAYQDMWDDEKVELSLKKVVD